MCDHEIGQTRPPSSCELSLPRVGIGWVMHPRASYIIVTKIMQYVVYGPIDGLNALLMVLYVLAQVGHVV